MRSETKVTRRAALAIGAAAVAGSLAGCSGKTEVERISEANEAIIASLDLGETRLPLGSVVVTRSGRYMIAGHKCVSYGEGNVAGSERYAWDYYGVAWPLGIRHPGSEGFYCALMNVSDIEAVEFIGLVNEEDRDLRAYIDGIDMEAYAGEGILTAPSMVPVLYSESTALEQQMRLQGARSEELYGEMFGGGLLSPSAQEE